ncbi:MAG: ABC transporter permease [Bacteroidetes bacterium]|nr:ABC transporter permease [Bacteroidota bacterium]
MLYPISEQLTELVSFLAGFILFIGLMVYLNLNVNITILYIIPIIMLFSIFTFSVGLILGFLNVFFRDIGILWNTLNPALFYLTPIAYAIDIIPQEYSYYFKFNPLYHFLYIIRNVLHQGCAPEFYHSIFCLIITLITVCLSILFIEKQKRIYL